MEAHKSGPLALDGESGVWVSAKDWNSAAGRVLASIADARMPKTTGHAILDVMNKIAIPDDLELQDREAIVFDGGDLEGPHAGDDE